MTVSERHAFWGEVFGVFCWLWVFERARQDLPVVLGYRHPWDHVEDPFQPNHHSAPKDKEAILEEWDKFSSKAIIQKEVDDDDEEDDNEEDEDDE